MSGSLWIGLCLLIGVLWLELVAPQKITEGFAAIGAATRPAPILASTQLSNRLTSAFGKRGDIGLGKEQGGYKQDLRYFSDWADVQRIGSKNDYCRMVFPDGGTEADSFFACALGGSAGLSAVSYRTRTVAKGFRKSRDDYMNRVRSDGRDAYCRILKDKDGTFQPLCLNAEDTAFGDRDVIDNSPPEDVKTLLDFYRGCRMWLRFRDDMLDYVGDTIIQTAGAPSVLEIPRPAVTRGLTFNGKDQFLRIGDTDDLSLGRKGSLRSVRAFSIWVKFDEFTNNAHIFDFGNGAGKDNVFLGILGKGDADQYGAAEVRPGPICQESTVPTGPSGAQCVPEVRVQELVTTTRANIEEYVCLGPEVLPDPARATPIVSKKDEGGGPRSRATLLYEVWDSRLRKMQIRLNRVIPKGRWTHIVITAKNMDALRPDILVYINGNLWYTKESGHLPQAGITEKNYIGKSNWADVDEEFELRDELFAGSVFDFRMYKRPISEAQVKRTLAWGMGYLGLSEPDLSN